MFFKSLCAELVERHKFDFVTCVDFEFVGVLDFQTLSLQINLLQPLLRALVASHSTVTVSGCSCVSMPPMLTVTIVGKGVDSVERFCERDMFQGM